MFQNAKLKNAVKLSSKVTVYVPATIHTQEIDNSEQVDRIASEMSRFFGGSTSTPAIGYWLSGAAGLIREKTTIVFAYCNEADLHEHIEELIETCEQMKREMAQEAIALEINGEMYFI